MPEAPANNSALKIKALELANGHNETHDAVVKRAQAYHGFLAGTVTAPAAAKPATPPTGAQGAGTGKPAPAAAKPGAPAGGKPAPAAGKPAPAAAKPGAPAGGKPAPAAGKPAPAAKPGPTANKPAPQSAAGAPDPNGLIMDNVSAALQKVLNATVDTTASSADQLAQREVGKKNAYKILKDVAGVTSVRDVKPAQYKAVIDACEAAVTAPPAESNDNDFGAGDPPAVPISDDDNAVDTDPPEQTAGGANAEDV